MGMLQNKLSVMTQTREVGKLLKDIAEILDTLQGINCYIERSGNRWKINAQQSVLPVGTQNYQVLRWDTTANGGAGEWIADWVRAVDLT